MTTVIDDVDDNDEVLCMFSALKYYDVQKVNIRCKSICDQWNLLANLATKRREELEVTSNTSLKNKRHIKMWCIFVGGHI